MLTTFKDDNGNIRAVCEWWCVDVAGAWTPDGEYVWVNQIEISKGESLAAVFRDIIAEIAWLVPQGKGAYWERRDKQNNYLYAFDREQLLRYKRKEEVKV